MKNEGMVEMVTAIIEIKLKPSIELKRLGNECVADGPRFRSDSGIQQNLQDGPKQGSITD